MTSLAGGTCYTIVSIIGVLLNGILIVLVCKKTPKRLKSYSIFLTQLAVVDIIIAVINWLTIPRCHSVHPLVSYKYYGLCQLFGPVFCFSASATKMTMYAFSPMIILSSFVLRFLIMKHHEPPSRKKLAILSVVSYIPGIVYAVGSSFSANGSGAENNYMVVIYSEKSHKISMVLIMLIVTGGVVIGSIKCYLIVQIVDRRRASLFRRTNLLRKRLILSLALHGSIPLLQLIIGTIYIHTVLSNGPLEWCDIRFHIGSVLPCVNALITIFSIDPYRRALGNYLTG